MYKRLATLAVICAVAVLAGCTPPIRDHDYSLQREAIAGSHKPAPRPLNVGTGQANQPLSAASAAETHYGTGVFINPVPKGAPAHGATNTGGNITFNFDNQPVQAAVKAILGDVLHANYSIAPDVKGTVTFATSQPVTQAQVLPILQMLLSWTGNALVRHGTGYVVVPVDKAAPGNLVPGLGAASPGAGYAARLFPLHYVSADAMQKLLKPFATPKAFLLVDPLRNLLVMGGTPDELANYARIIRTFDVNWLRGMSVAVIPLQHVQADDLVSQLETLFNEKGSEPGEGQSKAASGPGIARMSGGDHSGGPGAIGNLSSMVRLIALKHSNSLVVISPQPSYIDEVRKLVTTIDTGAGNGSGLYVYNVINVKASALAKHLNELFGNPSKPSAAPSGAVAPGFSPLEQMSAGGLGTPSSGFSSFTPDNGIGTGQGANEQGGFGTGAVSGATQARRQQQMNQQASVAFTTNEGVRIAAVNENNQLLVRARPAQWQQLLPAIERLDEKPLQVQIETRVLEVDLTGAFQFGVQYYLGGLIGTQPGSPPNTDESFHRHQGAVGLGGVQYPPASGPTPALFYSFAGNNLQFALSALESSGDAKVLSAPSAVVLNNQEATFKVGEQIPVIQTAIIPGIAGSSDLNSINAASVNYINTGVLLDVVPRVNPGGLVYMDIQQVVSSPQGSPDQYGNFTISNRSLSTEVAVQSGQTVLLGGLIQQNDTNQDNGVPFLNRIPVLGRLFGTTTRSKSRTELIVLITPTVIRNPEDARRSTDAYQTQFESLKPILPGGSASLQPASAPAAATPASALSASVGTAPPAAGPRGDWAVQVASFTHDADADALRARLQQFGFASYVDHVVRPAPAAWRVRAGPVVSRNAAEQLRRAIADSLHIQGMRVVKR